MKILGKKDIEAEVTVKERILLKFDAEADQKLKKKCLFARNYSIKYNKTIG